MSAKTIAERDDKRHFTGVGKCNIHTSRPTSKCGNAQKTCNHQTNCETPVATWKTPPKWVWGNEWESHHALCIESVNGYQTLSAYDSDERAKIDAVYRETKWCINQSPNLIALPLRQVYVKFDKSQALSLPCHNWDHNVVGGYRDEVTEAMHNKFWSKLRKVAARDVCKKAKVFKDDLDTLSKTFKNLLVRRGSRPVGEAGKGVEVACDKKNWNQPHWWLPLSMAKNDIAKARRINGLNGGNGWSISAADFEKLKQRWSDMRRKG